MGDPGCFAPSFAATFRLSGAVQPSIALPRCEPFEYECDDVLSPNSPRLLLNELARFPPFREDVNVHDAVPLIREEAQVDIIK